MAKKLITASWWVTMALAFASFTLAPMAEFASGEGSVALVTGFMCLVCNGCVSIALSIGGE